MDKKKTLQTVGIIAAITFAICVGPGLISGSTQVLTVMSESMSPAIDMGDVVIMKAVDTDTIRVGDIITYAPRTYGIVITHRVIEINDAGAFVTKGDAVKTVDVTPVKPEQVIGKHALTIPLLGYLLHYARQPIGFVIMIGIPALLLVLIELKSIFIRGKVSANERVD